MNVTTPGQPIVLLAIYLPYVVLAYIPVMPTFADVVCPSNYASTSPLFYNDIYQPGYGSVTLHLLHV